MKKSRKITASICILTFNGEKYLKEILDSIKRQKTNFGFETIIIDSGSKDKTLKIVKQYDVRLIQIKNKDFGHGKTRNLAIKESRGEFVVLLVQDATPKEEDWLQKIIDPFKNKEVVSVFGRHLPRPGGNMLTAMDINNHFHSLASKQELIFQKYEPNKKYSGKEWNKLMFLSDVNAAYRRSFVLENPFKEVIYAEDQLMGQSIIKLGFVKVYSPFAVVYHSHDFSIFKYFLRFVDEFRGYRDSLGYIDPINLITLLPKILRMWIGYSKQILKMKLNIFIKIKWIILSLFYCFSRLSAAFLVKLETIYGMRFMDVFSLEYWSKKKAFN